MKCFFAFIFSASAIIAYSQKSYNNSILAYQKNYVLQHEVVKGDDKILIQFFPVIQDYKVIARFEKNHNPEWLVMPTSARMKKTYKKYGILKFVIHNKHLQLTIYQSQNLMETSEYKNYLFLPFTDATNGTESYETGRYIDLKIDDIKNNKIVLDFNKAYNPYCAYVSGIYNCPIPPRENHLPIAIKAGEKIFNKQ